MNKNQTAIQLVCFDIGGVLIRIANDWREAFGLAGLPAPKALEMAKTITHHNQTDPDHHDAAFSDAAIAYETGKTDDATYLQAMMQRRTGMSEEEARSIMRVWLIEPFEGVSQIIDEVNATPATSACLSNTNLLHWRQMESDARYGSMLSKLDRHFTSFKMGVRKPEPGIYEQVEQTMGLPGQQILFFDDLEMNINAARARGWRAERINPRDNPARQMREHLKTHGLIER